MFSNCSRGMNTLMSESYTVPPERKRWELFTCDVPKPWHSPLESTYSRLGVPVSPLSLSLCHLTLICFYLCTECLVVPLLCFYRFLHETWLFVSSWFPTCASIAFCMRHSLSHFGSLSFSSGQRRNVLSTSDVQYGIPILRQRKIRNGLKKKKESNHATAHDYIYEL